MTTLCQSTRSDCIHPDPKINDNSTYYCNGGGEDPYRAADNVVNCVSSIVSTDPLSKTTTCLVNVALVVDTAVDLYVSPCAGFIGTQKVTCTTYRVRCRSPRPRSPGH